MVAEMAKKRIQEEGKERRRRQDSRISHYQQRRNKECVYHWCEYEWKGSY